MDFLISTRPLEVTLSAQSNVVLGCAVSVLVRDRGVLAKSMAIADPVDFAAEVSILVFVFVESEGESALAIIILLLQLSDSMEADANQRGKQSQTCRLLYSNPYEHDCTTQHSHLFVGLNP